MSKSMEFMLSFIIAGKWSIEIPSEGDIEADKVSVSYSFMGMELSFSIVNLKLSISQNEFSFEAELIELNSEEESMVTFVKNISIQFKNDEFHIRQGEAGGVFAINLQKFAPIIKNFIPEFNLDEGEILMKGSSSYASFSISSESQLSVEIGNIDFSYTILGIEIMAKIPSYSIEFNLISQRLEGEVNGINVGFGEDENQWIRTTDSIKFSSGFLKHRDN